MRRRTILQAASAAALNPYVPYFWKRVIYQGGGKYLCAPGLNCYACPLAVLSCPIGGLQLAFSRLSSAMRDLKAAAGLFLYVTGSVGMLGCLVGRMPCGWVCPFGFLQDLLFRLPLPELRLPRRLGIARYLTLLTAVLLLPALTGVSWFSRLCPAGTLEGGLLLQAAPPASPLPPTSWFFWLKLGLLVALLAWATVSRRPFCRVLCPLGAILGLFNRVSLYRMWVEEESCTDCGACRRVCPVDIDIREDPASPDCIRCLECKEACPRGAVGSGFRWLTAEGQAG